MQNNEEEDDETIYMADDDADFGYFDNVNNIPFNENQKGMKKSNSSWIISFKLPDCSMKKLTKNKSQKSFKNLNKSEDELSKCSSRYEIRKKFAYQIRNRYSPHKAKIPNVKKKIDELYAKAKKNANFRIINLEDDNPFDERYKDKELKNHMKLVDKYKNKKYNSKELDNMINRLYGNQKS